MKYDLSQKSEAAEAFQYLTKLATKDAIVEIKHVRPRRSLNQNNYLHLLLGAFGIHFGYTMTEAKQIYKELSKDIYYYTLKNRQFIRSSADLDTAEMTKTIDRFREASKEQGCPLPAATDEGWLRAIENDMENHFNYI